MNIFINIYIYKSRVYMMCFCLDIILLFYTRKQRYETMRQQSIYSPPVFQEQTGRHSLETHKMLTPLSLT